MTIPSTSPSSAALSLSSKDKSLPRIGLFRLILMDPLYSKQVDRVNGFAVAHFSGDESSHDKDGTARQH